MKRCRTSGAQNRAVCAGGASRGSVMLTPRSAKNALSLARDAELRKLKTGIRLRSLRAIAVAVPPVLLVRVFSDSQPSDVQHTVNSLGSSKVSPST